MYNLYDQHKGTMIIFPPVASVEEARQHAEASARLGYDGFFRVFEQTGFILTGPGRKGRCPTEQFVTSFSVLNGVVTEHADVTIPAAHW